MRFNTMVKKFVYFLEVKNEYSQLYADMIIENATAWNKEWLLEELTRQIKVFKEYDEQPDKVNFNYLPFCEQFLQERPKLFS